MTVFSNLWSAKIASVISFGSLYVNKMKQEIWLHPVLGLRFWKLFAN